MRSAKNFIIAASFWRTVLRASLANNDLNVRHERGKVKWGVARCSRWITHKPSLLVPQMSDKTKLAFRLNSCYSSLRLIPLISPAFCAVGGMTGSCPGYSRYLHYDFNCAFPLFRPPPLRLHGSRAIAFAAHLTRRCRAIHLGVYGR